MTSARIISLCLLVGQVQSLEKQNQRNQDNEVTATPLNQNVIIKNKNDFPFDINTRGWQIFDNWKINEPLVTLYGEITYSVRVGNRKRQHLLISGANAPVSYFEKRAGTFANWLYTVNTNSWQNVDNGDFPPIASSPLMVKFCAKIIALEARELKYVGEFKLGKAWIFDTVLLNWQKAQVDVEDHSPFWFDLEATDIRDIKVAAVAVVQTQNNCHCNLSAFVLLHSSNFRSSMYHVQCENRKGTDSYKWIHIEFNIQKTPRSRVNFLASSYSSTIVLYDPVDRTLWKFGNETWTNVTEIPYNLQSFHDASLSHKFGCSIATNRSFIVFNLFDKKVLNFNLERNEYIIESVVGDIPGKGYDVVSTVVENRNTITVFTRDLLPKSTRVWKFIYERKLWTWKRLSSPALLPSVFEVSSYGLKSNYFIFAPLFINKIDQGLWNAVMWNLDLTRMQWWKKQVSNSILYEGEKHYGLEYSGWIGSCCFITLSNKLKQKFIEVWLFNATDNKLKLLTSNLSIKVRYFMSFVAVNETTAIVFGGKNTSKNSNVAAFNETWIMHLQPTLQWRQVNGDIAYFVRPSARYHHAAVMMQSKMYVFGGKDASGACLSDFWMFDVSTERWSEVIADNRGPDPSNASLCGYSAASTPGQLFISVIYMYPYAIHSNKQDILESWMFIVHIKTWYLIAPYQFNDDSVKMMTGMLPKSIYWKGFLVMFDTAEDNIIYLEVRCPAGFSSSNISDRPCDFCKQGYYRETRFNDPDCAQCPMGLTTVNIGARKVSDCTVCDVNSCKHGKCVPYFHDGSLQPSCQCYVGFTGSTCQYPTYFLIGAGIILFVTVASAGVTAYLCLLKRKKMRERALRREVDALTDVWQIDENEVTSEQLVGRGASGSVYRGSYRNITVAVKKMVTVGLSKSIEDFETEIMFMRTVRHKNIVLFIGAGKSQPGDVPFLVMEYMERGSLKNVLYDLSIDIEYEHKLSFAMDSARGMHFLHTLEPPRIHRDLKSDNLVVSKDWTVKVADFGLGRDVNVTTNDRQQFRRRYRTDRLRVPLLPKRDGLSFSGIGTARWRAPELTLRESYDTAVDVYR